MMGAVMCGLKNCRHWPAHPQPIRPWSGAAKMGNRPAPISGHGEAATIYFSQVLAQRIYAINRDRDHRRRSPDPDIEDRIDED